jgi:hypothetical protein
LYWNKFSNSELAQYSFLQEGGADSVNQESAVLCDPSQAEPRYELEDHKGYVDMCKALCNLSHSEAECDLVQRQGKRCFRLFWADDRRAATTFSVRKATGAQIEVTVQEAFDKLMANNNDCASLCKAHPTCKDVSESHCRENRTCHNIFYVPGNTNTLSVCFGPECTDKTPIMCKQAGDAATLFPQVADPNTKSIPDNVASTTQGESKHSSSAVVVIATLIAIITTAL